MQLVEGIGLFAGALTTCSIIPQLIRIFKLKSAREISMLFTMLLLLGMVGWLIYGIYFSLIAVILWNAIGVSLVSGLLYSKLRYGK